MLESVIHRRDRGAELRIPKSHPLVYFTPSAKARRRNDWVVKSTKAIPAFALTGVATGRENSKIKSTLGVSKEGVKVDVDLETNWFGTTGVPIGSPHRGSLSKILHRPDIPIVFLTENRQLSAIGRRDAPCAGC